MKSRLSSILVLVLAVSWLSVDARAGTIDFGTAGPFAVLGEAGVTNTGPSTIYGSVSGSIGTPAVTGFTFSTSPGPGTVIPPGVGYITGVSSPFSDATTAYNALVSLAPTQVLTGQDLGGLTLNPGVYFFASSAQLTGTLILDALGSDDATWTFQIGSTLTTASASSVEVIDAGAGSFTGGINWAVGSAATLGTTTAFLGTIISNSAASTLDTGATIGCGRVISLGAAVTLDDNIIATPSTCVAAEGGGGTPIITAPLSPVPEPGTLISTGLVAIGLLTLRKSRAHR
jgi:type VI secretion system secreted protein VgrG